MEQTIVEYIREKLFALRDEGYAEFTAKLTPGVAPESIIGVRLPALRALAKELYPDARIRDFTAALPHRFHEENLFHALLIAKEKDFSQLIAELDAFLPYINNWAVCDTLHPLLFSRRFDEAFSHISRWVASGETYTIRFGVGMLMTYGLDRHFSPEHLRMAAEIESDEYYVNMMRAWYFATALAKRWNDTLPYLDGRLDLWTHNKTIQKAVESFRITGEQKTFLRMLRRKSGSEARRRINVAAAVVRRGDTVLICRRREGKARAFGWEFPGGKLEAGETAEQAIVRECREELAVTIVPSRILIEVPFDYPDVSVRLIAVEADIANGEPQTLEHSELRFVPLSELGGFELCPADRGIAIALTSGGMPGSCGAK